MKLEICASNYQSALNAQKAGAQRIELCSELAVGGITPSYGLIKLVIENINIPVFVLIRPRSGNFTYSNDDFEIMKQDIQLCKDLGCAGIVSGVLNADNTIDIERTQQIIELSRPLEFTFHRAFDWTPNPFEAMEALIKLKADRILTSGQDNSAEKGIVVLQQLQKIADKRIHILPGGGINSQNALIFKGAGFDTIHCSATTIITSNSEPKVSMNSPKFFDETISVYSDVTHIKAIIKTLADAE